MNRLLGHTLMSMAAGFILAGCAYDSSLVPEREVPKSETGLAIAFSNGVIDNHARVVTKAFTMLSDHSSTMGVWGWQTTADNEVERLFNNHKITFIADDMRWTYSPVKYWQNNCNYRFYAYAPHSSVVPGATVDIDSATHKISIDGVTLRGDNTISAGVTELPANFAGVSDVDWMIDRSGQSMAGVYRDAVMFNMQHILAKLCMRVCRTDTSSVAITIDSVKIGRFVSQGNFSQSFNVPLAPLAVWNQVDTLARYEITSARGVTVPDDTAVYILESLIIPQTVNSSQYIQVWYSIGNASGYMDHMNHIKKLDDLFGKFDTGKNYIITAWVGPEPISFSGDVQKWDDQDVVNKLIE